MTVSSPRTRCPCLRQVTSWTGKSPMTTGHVQMGCPQASKPEGRKGHRGSGTGSPRGELSDDLGGQR